MVRVLDRLKYHQVVLLTVHGDQNGAEFVAAVETLRAVHKIHVSSCGGNVRRRMQNQPPKNGLIIILWCAGASTHHFVNGNGAGGVGQPCARPIGTEDGEHGAVVRKVRNVPS